MKIKIIRVSGLVLISLVLLLAGNLAGCAPKVDGSMPRFALGDTWVGRYKTAGEIYTVTSRVTGEEIRDGKDCWRMETTYEPAYKGQVSGTTTIYEKENLDIVYTDYHLTDPTVFTNISYIVSGTPYYPLEIGKESTEIEDQTITSGNITISQEEKVTVSYITKVEKIEKITVEAGTFDCYKVLKYDEYGVLLQTTWRSDKVKLFQVRMQDAADDDSYYELVSFTMY